MNEKAVALRIAWVTVRMTKISPRILVGNDFTTHPDERTTYQRHSSVASERGKFISVTLVVQWRRKPQRTLVTNENGKVGLGITD